MVNPRTDDPDPGDKAEISSIDEVFCQTPGRASDIYVGSIKANIGHLECASGIAALIKSVMVLKKGFVPANINLETLKPALQAHVEGRPIKVNFLGYNFMCQCIFADK